MLVAVGVVVFGCVLGLGLLAGQLSSAVRGGDGEVPVQTRLISVAPGQSLWDVAQRFAPDSSPAAVVDRIQELNGLADAVVHPGTPLTVPYGAVTD